MQRRFGRIRYKDFRGGLVQDYLADVSSSSTDLRKEILPTALSALDNMVVGKDGLLTSRCGFKFEAANPVSTAKFLIPYSETRMVSVLRGSTYDSIYLVQISAGVLSYSTNAVYVSSGFRVNGGVSFQGRVYLATNAGIVAIDDSTFSTPLAAVLTSNPFLDPLFLCVHNNRLWSVSATNTGTIESSEVGLPSASSANWGTGWSAEIPGETCTISGLASLEDQLFIFTNTGVWLLSGTSPETYRLDKISQEGKMALVVGTASEVTAGQAWTCQQVTLPGFGRCVVFVDSEGMICAVNRSGVVKMCRGLNLLPQNVSTSPQRLSSAYVAKSGQYMVSDAGTSITVVFCNLPHTSKYGTQWPAAKYSVSTVTVIDCLASRVFSVRGTSSLDRPKEMVVASLQGVHGTGAIFSHIDAQPNDADFFVQDDVLTSSGNKYYQVLAKIRTRPENAGSHNRKRWRRAVVETSNQQASTTISAFSGKKYFTKALSGSVAISSITPSNTMPITIDYVSEHFALELSFYSSDAGSSTSPKSYLELHSIEVEFEADQ